MASSISCKSVSGCASSLPNPEAFSGKAILRRAMPSESEPLEPEPLEPEPSEPEPSEPDPDASSS